ncbi:MAG: hypothetical protein ACRC8S_18305 [Fimbriiglobus sp.]
MSVPEKIVLPSKQLAAGVVDLLKSLKTGDGIKITHLVRVGGKKWTAEASGSFRGVNYLSTGITTDRLAEDDIVVPTVHFTKANGELASIALDENTKIEKA